MKWKLAGAVLLAVGGAAGWQASMHMQQQTRLIVEVVIAIACGGIGLRLLFPGSED
jgi:hypothetical protein